MCTWWWYGCGAVEGEGKKTGGALEGSDPLENLYLGTCSEESAVPFPSLPSQANSGLDLYKTNQITSLCEWILGFTRGILSQRNHLRIPLNSNSKAEQTTTVTAGTQDGA